MKIKAVCVLTPLLLVLSMTLAGTMTFADDGAVPRERLTSEIDYRFVGHLDQLDDEGRLLVWQGVIEGDFTGEMKWWFVQPSPVSGSRYVGGEVVFYVVRRLNERPRETLNFRTPAERFSQCVELTD